MILFWGLFYLILASYCTTILFFTQGWKKIVKYHPKLKSPDTVFLSVIIALRNEGHNISKIRSLIKSQNDERNQFEVILINDHSEDNTLRLIKNLAAENENVIALSLPDNEYGKKAGIRKGIKSARGELLIFTDADCSVPTEWLRLYNSFYLEHNKPDMIIGLVDMVPADGVWEKCFRLDFLSLVISSAGATATHHPIFNNAANLGVKKSSVCSEEFLQNQVASGDDVFLLHSFKSQKKRIEILKSQEHIVQSSPPKNLQEFLRQRIRWASKAGYYKDTDSIFVAWVVFLLNLFFIISSIVTLFTPGVVPLLVAFLIKTLVDLNVFLSGKPFFNLKKEFFLIPVIELMYPLYIVFSAIMGKKKPFLWKGRSIR